MKKLSADIQSYEPYHIGIKINNSLTSDIPSFRYKLISAFRPRMSQDELNKFPFPTGIEVLRKTNQVRVELNYDAFALNTIGNAPKSTLKTYKQVLSEIESLNYEVDGFAAFHEVLSNVNIKVKDKPVDIIAKLSKINLRPFKTIAPIQTIGIKLGIPEINADEIFNIFLEVNPVSPQTMLIMRFMYRNKNKDKIFEFSNKIDQLINSFFNSVTN